MFSKATRTKLHGRIALCGPPGSGKTYTALMFAKALAGDDGHVAVIDTERRSASKYAGDVADFDVCELSHFDPRQYVKAIRAAGEAGYRVLVIDSLSHAWTGEGGALSLVDKEAAKSKSRNTFAAWRHVTPLHNALVDAILQFPGHVIATLRTKVEYVIEKDSRGRSMPRKVGMAPVQRDGVEYEFDLVAEMDNARLVVTKSRCSSLHDAVIDRPGEDFARTFLMWLDMGADPPTGPKPAFVGVDFLGELADVHDDIGLRDWCERHAPRRREPRRRRGAAPRPARRHGSRLHPQRRPHRPGPRLGHGGRVNSVHLIGNLGLDPELRATGGGTPVLRMRLAVGDRRKAGDRYEDVTHWFTVKVFGKRAEGLAGILAKGDRVGVSGKLDVNTWEDRDGNRRTSTDVVAFDVTLCGGRKPQDSHPARQRGEGQGGDWAPF